MGATGDKPKRGEVLRNIIDFVFGFENRRGEILSHWVSFADGFSFSPQEFYQKLQEQLDARNIPDIRIAREEFGEGGMLSDRRGYLRIMRERLAIDACAAPFGNIYFFSCRTSYVPALVRLWHILATLAFFCLLYWVLLRPLGFTFALLAVITLVFAGIGMLRNAAAHALAAPDALLLRIPVLSTIYQDWFREDTYYREDTRLLYLKVLPDLIKELAEETVAAKGVKLEQQYERAPIFTDLYKPVVRSEVHSVT